MTEANEYHAYVDGHKVAEIFRYKKKWRVYWPSRGAVEDFRSLQGALARVSEPFTVHGRAVQFRPEN